MQEYIKPKTDTIIRVEFVDNQFLYAVQVDISKGFDLCPADACNVEKEAFLMNATGNKFMILNNFADSIICSYQKVLKNNCIEIAGIEFLMDENERLFTYDINTNTNYNSIAESLYAKKGMEEIAKFLKQELDLL